MNEADILRRLGLCQGEETLLTPETRFSMMESELKIAQMTIAMQETAIANWKQVVRRLRNPERKGVMWDEDGWNYLVFKNIDFHGFPPRLRFYGAYFDGCEIKVGNSPAQALDFKSCRFTNCTFIGDFTRTIFDNSRFRMCRFLGAKFTERALLGVDNRLQYFKDRGAKII